MHGGRTCPVTGEPLPDDRYVSGAGMARYESAVNGLRGTLRALDDVKAGRVRHSAALPVMGAQTGSRPACSVGVLDAAGPHERTLLKWGKWCAREMGLSTPQDWAATLHALRGGAQFTGRPWAATMITEVIAAVRAIRAIIDPEPEGRFWGRCLTIGADGVCDASIYAPDGTTWARCPQCGTQWDLPDLLERHLGVAADHMVTASEGAAILSRAGVPIRASTIRAWRHRQKLPGESGDFYRIGDLLSAAM